MKRFLMAAAILLDISLVNAQSSPKGLKVNDIAPGFSVKDQNGKLIQLKDLSAKGNVVLIFYRGQWCPYCNKQLKELEDSLSFIKAKGASLIAVTAEKTENISTTIKKTNASYSILHDDSLKIMKAYDVAFTVDQKTITAYKNYGIDFTEVNGTANGASLPVPAVYIISKEGKIVYRYFNADYTKRTSVAEILGHL